MISEPLPGAVAVEKLLDRALGVTNEIPPAPPPPPPPPEGLRPNGEFDPSVPLPPTEDGALPASTPPSPPPKIPAPSYPAVFPLSGPPFPPFPPPCGIPAELWAAPPP